MGCGEPTRFVGLIQMLMVGWTKQIVALQPGQSQIRREDSVIYTAWAQNQTLQDILAVIWDKKTDYTMPSSELQSLENRFLE